VLQCGLQAELALAASPAQTPIADQIAVAGYIVDHKCAGHDQRIDLNP